MRCIDPVKFGALCWPDMVLYDKQREILYSVRDNDETYVTAGNMLGKDYDAGYAALWFFLTRRSARVVTTSVDEKHLSVLWGEIDRFIRTSKYPLTHDEGGPLLYNHREIRKVIGGRLDKYQYLIGRVSEKGEGLSGHHAQDALLLCDEVSAVDDKVYEAGQGWMTRLLVIGNPNPCENFFKRGVKGGDLLADDGHYYRKVIRIRAEDSPNVRFGLEEKRRGLEPSNRIVIPGVLSYAEYVKRRALWSPMRQSVGLDGEFYEGAEVFLYPADWLNAAEQRADALGHPRRPQGRVTMGVDAAEGGDSTVFVACDEAGVLDLLALKTRDTSVIMGRTIALAQQWSVRADAVYFDAGGGGKQHADYLRSRGWNVRTVAFGGAVTPQIKTVRFNSLTQRVDQSEERYVYKNRRAEMYGLLRRALDPGEGGTFALPACYGELRRQLELMPLRYDPEGRLYLPSKNKRGPNSTEQCLVDIIGHSPDEADALVLASFGQRQKSQRVQLVSA
jgi:hypothetical protein